MIKDAFQENLAVCKLPGIWTALNLEPEIKTQKKKQKKTIRFAKYDTGIKIYKTQKNLRWSVSKCQNFGSFLQIVTINDLSCHLQQL